MSIADNRCAICRGEATTSTARCGCPPPTRCINCGVPTASTLCNAARHYHAVGYVSDICQDAVFYSSTVTTLAIAARRPIKDRRLCVVPATKSNTDLSYASRPAI